METPPHASSLDYEYYHNYWCWSRRDFDETTLKNTIIISDYVEDKELQDLISQPFSMRYHFNGSHFQCDKNESWNDRWFSVETESTSPCITNTSLPVNVKYHAANKTL